MENNQVIYAQKVKTILVKEENFPYQNQQFNNQKSILNFTKELLISSNTEKFIALYMDNALKLVCIKIFEGTVDCATVYPREVIAHAIFSNATAVAFIHNHPSRTETVRPSEQDVKITNTLCYALNNIQIRVLDHFIIGNNGNFFSFSDENLLPLV